MNKFKILSMLIFVSTVLAVTAPCVKAQDASENNNNTASSSDAPEVSSASAPKTASAAAVLLGDQQEIKKIRQKAAEKKEVIKSEIENIELTTKENEKVVSEVKILEKETQLKEQAAGIAKQELEMIKKEAQITGDKKTENKIRELARESYELDKQAELSKRKLVLAEEKSKLAQESVAKSNLAIEALSKEIISLRKQKDSKQGLLSKFTLLGGIIAFGVLLMFLLGFAVRKFENAISDKDAIRETESILRLKTLSALFKWVGSFAIIGICVYMILDNLGVDMAPILASAGILGLAVGFGGQYLIRDVINGIFILIEGQYRIDDVVKIGDIGGLVEAVNLRHTRLRDLEGRVIYIPNGKVEIVINYTQEYAQALLNIGVAYKENIDQVIAVLIDIGAGMRQDKYFSRLILDNLEMLGVDDFADSQITVKCRIKTLPIKQWEVAREFRRRVKNKFDELDIEIPFPHRTIYQGKDKDMSKFVEWQEKRKKETNAGAEQGYAGDELGG